MPDRDGRELRRGFHEVETFASSLSVQDALVLLDIDGLALTASYKRFEKQRKDDSRQRPEVHFVQGNFRFLENILEGVFKKKMNNQVDG